MVRRGDREGVKKKNWSDKADKRPKYASANDTTFGFLVGTRDLRDRRRGCVQKRWCLDNG